jgi:hypothetical protein
MRHQQADPLVKKAPKSGQLLEKVGESWSYASIPTLAIYVQYTVGDFLVLQSLRDGVLLQNPEYMLPYTTIVVSNKRMIRTQHKTFVISIKTD